jgi:tetratricopeptide (TPR) repeat protein
MALIKCPECGKEISDKSSICIHCGYPISEMKQNSETLQEELLPENELLLEKQLKRDQDSSIKEEKKNFKIKPIYILGTVVAVIIIVVGICQHKTIQKRNNELQAYNNAIYAYENENFQDAYEYFSNNEYKDSKDYLEKTIEKYIESLINDNLLEEADKYLALVNDEVVKKDLETKLTYAHGLDCFNKGLFVNARKIFTDISDYKDSENYLARARFMSLIQGEWILQYYQDGDYHNRGAMKIDGWNAATYIASGDRFEERASCTLEMNDDNTVSFKTSDIEYNMYYAEGKGYIGATLIKDSYYESLRESYYPLTRGVMGKQKMI